MLISGCRKVSHGPNRPGVRSTRLYHLTRLAKLLACFQLTFIIKKWALNLWTGDEKRPTWICHLLHASLVHFLTAKYAPWTLTTAWDFMKPKRQSFYFFKLELIFSVVLISAVQQGDSGIHIYIYIHILVHIFSHDGLHACCALGRIRVFVMLWTVVHGILQARTVEWVAMPFSRGSSRPRDWTRVSSSAGELFNTEPPKKSIIVPPRVFSIVPCFSIL